jgi:hypothetical protein
MTKDDLDGLIGTVASVVKEFVGNAIGAISRRVDSLTEMAAALDQRFAALPPPKDGLPGASAFQIACLGGFQGSEGEWLESLRGKDGDPGKHGMPRAEIEAIAAEAVKSAAGLLPLPKDGSSVTLDDLRPVVASEVAAAVALIPAPKDGKSFDEPTLKQWISSLLSAEVASLPKPKDGDSVHPDTVALMVTREVAKALAELPRPKDGDPGRDATQYEPLLSIEDAKSYPRGTFAAHRGGMIRSFRQTDPVGDAGLFAAGWAVMLNGIASESEETANDGRTDKRVTHYTDGTVLERVISRSVVIDRGVYREGTAYAKGDGVSWGGSFWIAQRDTEAKPDAKDGSWRLSVKKGQDKS